MQPELPKPIDTLNGLSVYLTKTKLGTVRVQVVDPRCGLRLLDLAPADAAAFAAVLAEKATRAGAQSDSHGWTSGTSGHYPGA